MENEIAGQKRQGHPPVDAPTDRNARSKQIGDQEKRGRPQGDAPTGTGTGIPLWMPRRTGPPAATDRLTAKRGAWSLKPA